MGAVPDTQERGDVMPASKAQQKAVTKYMQKNYDQIQVRTPKGKKEQVQAHAESKGESVNSFINRAIDHEMDRDTQEGSA